MEGLEDSPSTLLVKDIEPRSDNERDSEDSCGSFSGLCLLQGQGAYFHTRLDEIVAGDPYDLDAWSVLIEEVERKCIDNLDIISIIYDSLLSRFPLCHWYWRKYADHAVRLSDAHAAVKVFECAVGSATFSVGLWVDYCRFGVSFYEDPFDVRRLFQRALMYVRRDYLCHALWNEYIKFELSQQNWEFLANIYLQVLRFPTGYLHKYYENFEHFVDGMEKELRKCNQCGIEVKPRHNGEVMWSDYEISQVIKDLQYPANEAVLAKAVHMYQYIGEEFYQKANKLDERIKLYETNIKRLYFDTAPLDEGQLQNWHQYLDFVEKQEDFDWAQQLYERCLIPCAYFPEFWMRYVEFMESKGAREFANSALDRATQVFLKNVPEINLFNARFKEQIGDSVAASAALAQCDFGSGSYLPKHIIELANIQRRLGCLEEACATLDKAINMTEKMRKLHNFSSLFIYYCRLKYLITGSVDTAREVLIDGIQRIPDCSQLLEELIKFAMTHEGSKQVNFLDSIIDQAISPSTSAHGSQSLALTDRQRISSLFLEFVDLCGTSHDVRNAWIRHVRLFPQSVRNNVVDMHVDSVNCFSDRILEERENGYRACRILQPEGRTSNPAVQDQMSVVPMNHASKVEVACADQITWKCIDDMECEEDNLLANDPSLAASEVNEVISDRVPQQHNDTPEVKSDNFSPQMPEGERAGPATRTLVHLNTEDTSGSNEKTCSLHEYSEAIAAPESPRKHSISFDKQDQELEQCPNPISLDNLSLHSVEKASSDLIIVASDQLDPTLIVSKSDTNGPQVCLNSEIKSPASSPNGIPAIDSGQVQESSGGAESGCFSSSASEQKRIAIDTHPDSLATLGITGEHHLVPSVANAETSGVNLPSKLQHSTLKHEPIPRGSHMPISQAYSPRPSIQEPLGHSKVQNREGGAQGSSQPVTANYSQISGLVWEYPQLPSEKGVMLTQQQYQQSHLQLHPFQLRRQHNQQYLSSWQPEQKQSYSVPYQVHQLQHQQQAHQQIQHHYHQLTQQLQFHQGQVPPVNCQQLELYYQSEKVITT
ncbi:OLC1v1022099C1 [Oldenlandia corymbosa var. corymbosa]|uniref:OLC1v1022099C1 n=1 Tax=Oldenlandia corymbosa var. corymbosa TaxID=529605 RepID=A0AAV1BXT7_OLDCO|nr:OLC1v1022099C1 [Oldenlandia corymbosa var. corymbosa]